MTRSHHHRALTLMVVFAVVLGSLPLGIVSMSTVVGASSQTSDGNISNPTDEIPDDQLFKGTEDGQVVVWERAFLPLRSDDTGAATQVPLPGNLQLQQLEDGSFTSGDDGTSSSQLVASFDGTDNPAGVHDTGVVNISYDANRISGIGSTISGEDNVDFIAARLTGTGERFPDDYSDAVTNVFGSVENANENATFETIQSGETLTDGTAKLAHNFDQSGQYVVYAVANEDGKDGFQINNGQITTVDGTVAIVGVDMVSVHQGAASTTAPSNPSVGETLSFNLDTESAFDQSQDGQMTHVVAVYEKDTFENSRFDLVVDQNELGPNFDLDDHSQIEHSIVNANGVADIEDGITISGADLSDGRVTRSVGIGAIIDRLGEDLGTSEPATDPLDLPRAKTINASVVGVTGEDRSATIAVETTSEFDTGEYQYIVVSKPADDTSSLSTKTGTLTLQEQTQTGATITSVSLNDGTKAGVATGDSATVTVSVKNPTDSSLTETLTLSEGGTELDSTGVTIPSGESSTGQLSAIFQTTGTRTLTIGGETVSDQTVDVGIVSPTERTFSVSPTNVEVDEQVRVDATVVNNRASTQTIPVEVTGLPSNVDNTRDVQVAGESSKTVTFTFSYSSSGTREISVTDVSRTVAVDVAKKTVTLDVTASRSEAEPGEDVSFTVTRSDTNDNATGVDLQFERTDSDSSVPDESSVSSPFTRTFDTPGQYRVTATKSDGNINFVSDATDFTVLQPTNLNLTSASTPYNEVIASQDVSAQATIENTGGIEGTQTVRLVATDTDEGIATRSVTVSPGGTRTITLAGALQPTGTSLPEDRPLAIQRVDANNNVQQETGVGSVNVTSALRVTKISPQARLVSTGDQINIDVTVSNQGTSTLKSELATQPVTLTLGNKDPITKAFSPDAGQSATKTYTFSGFETTGERDLLFEQEFIGSSTESDLINVTSSDIYDVALTPDQTAVETGQTISFNLTSPGDPLTLDTPSSELEATLQVIRVSDDTVVTTTQTQGGQATLSLDEPGTYVVETTDHQQTIAPDAAADPGSVQIQIQEPGDVRVVDATIVNPDVAKTEPVTVSVVVANDGETSAKETVSIVGRDNAEASENVPLNGGALKTIELNTSFTTTGTRSLEVATQDSDEPAVAAGQVQVNQALEVTDIQVSQRSVNVDDSVTVDVVVTNEGSVSVSESETTRTLALSIGSSDSSVPTEEVTKSAFAGNLSTYTAGQSRTITFTPDSLNPATQAGTRTIAVDGTDGGQVSVSRKEVPLSLSITGGQTVGDDVTFEVTRTDTGNPVDATIRFSDRPSLSTGSDGTVTTTFDSPFTGTATAVKGITRTAYFIEDSQALAIKEPANIEIASSNVDVIQAFAGQEVTVTTTVTNTGGSTGNRTITLTDSDGTVLASQTVSLGAGSRKTITFTPELNEIGSRTLTVGDTTAGTVTVDEAVAITGTTVPSAVTPGEEITVDVEVTDRVTDSETGAKEVTIAVGDQSVGPKTITPSDGETTTESFTFSFADTGTQQATIDTAELQSPAAIGEVAIAQNTVALEIATEPDPATVQIGEEVTFTVRRKNDSSTVDATVDVAGQVLNTGEDGTVTTTIPVSGDFTATASKAGTTSTAFESASTPVTVNDPIDLRLSDFGTVQADPARDSDRPSQTRTLTISNDGGRAISLGGFGFTGTNADQYTITSSIPESVPANSDVTVDVTFRPTIRTQTSAKLRFRTDTPQTPVRTVSLSGTGEAPNVTVDTTTLDFGSTLSASDLPVDRTVTATNDGNAPLTISPGGVNSAFSVDKGETTIQPGDSETYTVTLDPSQSAVPARFGDVLQLSTDDPFEQTVAVSLSGTVSQGELNVRPASTDVGSITVGETETIDVVVSNTGTKEISSVTANHGTSSNGLTITGPTDGEGVVSSLEPGEQALVEVQVKQVGDASSSSVDLDLDPSGEASTQTLSISATPSAPVLNVSPTVDSDGTTDELTYGRVSDGSATSEQITIENTGDAPLHLTNIRVAGPERPFSLVDVSGTMVVPAGQQQTIPVQLSPATTGVFEDSSDLVFDWNDPSKSGTTEVRFDLRGKGVETSLSGNTSSVAFGATGEGSTVDQSISLTNDGNTDLAVTSISLGGADSAQFSVNSDAVPETIAASESTTLPVTYTPTTTGNHTARVTVSTSSDNGISTFTATLRGQATPPDIRVSDQSLAFGYVNKLSDSSASARTSVTNTGLPSTTLSITDVSVSGNDAFSLTNSPTSAGDSAVVEFDPDSGDSGKVTGTLTITSNDPDESSVDVSLIGTATAPDAVANRSQVTFGDVRSDTNSTIEAVEITNDGGAPVEVTDTSLDSSSQFMIVSGISETLVPGESATVIVRATPSNTGKKSTSLTVTTNRSGDVSPISLTADGVAPSVTVSDDLSGDFGDVSTSSSETQSLTVRNTGEALLVLDEIGASGTAFSVLGNQQTITLAPDESTTITVAFSPSAPSQTFDGTFSITTNDDDSSTITRSLTGTGAEANTTLSQSAVDFGAVDIETSSTEELTLTNDGNAPLSVTSVTVSGADSSAFDVSGLGTPTLDPGESRTFDVQVTPAIANSLTAQLTIQTDQSASDVTVALGATGVEPNIEVSQQQVTIDRTRLGTTNTATVQVNNTGNAPLNVRDVLLSSSTDQFGVNTNSAVIPAKGSRTLKIRFSPPVTDVSAAKDGTKRSATLTLRSNDTDQASMDISVDARSKTPDLDVPNVLRFGTLRVSEDTTQQLEVTNLPSATAAIDLSSLTLLGRDANEFSVTTGETELEPGSSTTIDVTATPETSGIKTASLLLVTNDTRQPRESVSVSNSRTVVIVRYGSVTFDYNGVTTVDPKFKSSDDPKTGVIGIDPILTTTTDFEMKFSERAATSGPEIGNSQPIVPVRYLDISTTGLDPSQHNQTTVQFRVPKTKIASLDASKNAISLYQYDGSQYAELSTSRLPSEDTATEYAYSATIESLNALAIGAGQSRLSIVDGSTTVSDVPNTLKNGQSAQISVSADIENVGSVAGTETFSIKDSSGTPLTSQTVSVNGGETQTVTFTVPLTGPGQRTLTVEGDGTTSQTQTIDIKRKKTGGNNDRNNNDDTDDDSDDTDDEQTTEESSGTPGATITQTGQETRFDINVAPAGKNLVIPGGQVVTTSGGNFSVSETRITPTASTTSVSITVSASATPPVNVSTLSKSTLAHDSTEAETRISPVGYITVSTTGLKNANTSSGTITFDVSQSVLDSQRVSTDDVALYRFHDGRYQRLNTTHLGENRFEAATPGFSTFAIGVDQRPEISVDSVALEREEISPGESVSVTTTVVNDGSAAGTIPLELTVDSTTVATQNVTVSANETRTQTLTTIIEQAGEYELAVNGVSANTVQVEAVTTESPETPDETDSSETPDETDSSETPKETSESGDNEAETTTTSSSGPGFGATLAVVALLGAALLVLRRRD